MPLILRVLDSDNCIVGNDTCVFEIEDAQEMELMDELYSCVSSLNLEEFFCFPWIKII